MDRKIVKVISILFVIFVVFSTNASVFAAKKNNLQTPSTITEKHDMMTGPTNNQGGVQGVGGNSGSGLTSQFNGNNGTNTSKGETILQKVIGPILSVVRIVAVGVSIIMITFLGIKYMAAAPSEKASIKNQLVTFTIGAVVVVGATSILTMIKNFAMKTF